MVIRCCGWLPGCYVVVSVLWVVVMWLLGYCGWLPGCCLVVSMLWVVAKGGVLWLLGAVGGCQGVMW